MERNDTLTLFIQSAAAIAAFLLLPLLCWALAPKVSLNSAPPATVSVLQVP